MADRRIAILLFIFAAALLGYGWIADPFYFGPHDGQLYFQLAGQSLEKGAFTCGLYDHAYWPPVWIELTAGLYRVFTHHPRVIQIFLSLCALGSAYVVYLWGRKVLGTKPALWAAGLSLGGVFIFKYTTYHQYELFVGFCLVLASFLIFSRSSGFAAELGENRVRGLTERDSVFAEFVRRQWRRLRRGQSRWLIGAIAGLLISFAVLSAAKSVVIGLLLGAVLLFRAVKKVGSERSAQSVFKAGAPLLAYSFVGLLVASFWVARNYNCFEEVIPLTTNGGIVYFMAHNPKSQLKGYVDPYSVSPEITPEVIARHESSRWYKMANEYIVENPGRTFVEAFKKFWMFFNPHYADQFVVILLCVFVFWRRFRKQIRFSADSLWWLAVPVSFALLHSMYHFEPRYIVPVWPFLSLFAAQAFATRVK